MTKQEALFTYLLRLGDNALVMGHRLSEWSSFAPILEEDLALTNIALDHIGRAQALLKYAAEIEGKGRTEDDLAYKRPERQFLNVLLVEQPNGDFASTIARQIFHSAFELQLFEALSKSKDETLSGLAARCLKEVKYHWRHAFDWLQRLGDGTEESHERMQKGIDDLWMYSGELFEIDDVEAMLIEEGIAVDNSAFYDKWNALISEALSSATITRPEEGAYMQTGGRKGVHTENLGFILAEMQYLPRAYPDAKW
ncbi:MAG: 1,2-phenylacetyl-CoA epoxidase subunit PaaC [Bacteroidota bacterium]|nr:1,2-phenylacetyl-CoA epoxidase subunit PaaC [Bacteroidota bacterium]MDP4230955.1 1,2-phenylacetyl-CoA epoxidase subunit PaaC [Bacteroidota bacterium]